MGTILSKIKSISEDKKNQLLAMVSQGDTGMIQYEHFR